MSWDKCRGLNFALEVGPFCLVSLVTLQIEVLNILPQSPQGSLLLGYLFYLTQNALQCLNLINYTWQQPAQSDFSGLVHFFAKAHKKSQDNNFE